MKFLADENFDGRILAALVERIEALDVLRVQDTEIYQAPDPTVLAWAARHERILLTHDVQTLINDAFARVRAGLAMPGVIEVQRDALLGQAIDELEIMLGASSPADFADQVRFIPLR